MEKFFANRMSLIKASEIRELLKLTEKPEILSFAGGLPAAELFPLDKIAEVAEEVVQEDGKKAMQYQSTEGFNPLRKIIIEQRLTPMGIKADLENIMITSGSQQGLEFSAKLFINEGDVIITESPSYLGAINAFKVYNPKFVEIEMDKDGMKMDALEEALKNNKNVKYIYTIPDFQNPSGVTLSLERRKKLIELANKYDVLILEDCPYSELKFTDKKLPSLKSLDTEDRVIHLGTFSKTFAPGLRIGWIVACPEIINKYVMIKQGADLQSSSLDQRIAARFMEKHDLNQHIASIIGIYKNRRDIMFNAIEKYWPENVEYTKSEGGLFTWVKLRDDLKSKEVMEDALKENVAYVPGDSFFPNGGKYNYFRLNYSCMNEEQIEEGMKRLGNVLHKYYSK